MWGLHPDHMNSFPTVAVLQSSITIGAVMLLWSLHARLDRPVFKWWAWAWTCFALYLGIAALAGPIAPHWTPSKAALIVLAAVFGFLPPPLLVFGGLSVGWPARPSTRELWGGLTAAVAAGVIAVLVSTAVVFIGRLVPLPFTDQTALQEQLGGGFLGLFDQATPPVPILALGVTWLFFIRLFTAGIVEGMGRGSRARVQAIGFVVYMLVSALSALSLCIYLESVESGFHGAPAVVEPGWGFRLLGTLTLLAGAALVWAPKSQAR